MTIAEALNRTTLLMRTDLDPETNDALLVEALTTTTVVLIAGADTLASHSGQSAFVTAALLMARCGHKVWLDAPDVDLVGAQPPLRRGHLIGELGRVGDDLLPDWRFQIGCPAPSVDAAVTFGAAAWEGEARQHVTLNADDWSADLGGVADQWRGREWPIGGLAAGALAAAEVFKISMRKLRAQARAHGYFDDLYAPCGSASVRLAPPETGCVTVLPTFDFISGGAIANAFFYAMYRLPDIEGRGRVFDDDRSALSNLNRNALLVRSALDAFKVDDLARFGEQVVIEPQQVRFGEGAPLADITLVGVDDIRSRWLAQRTNPTWLGVGATEGFNIQVSSHEPGQACVGCLHPVEAAVDGGPIPTIAFVSFWSGLMLAVRWLRALAGSEHGPREQQMFLNALRPESWGYGAMPVAANPRCPVECDASKVVRAPDRAA